MRALPNVSEAWRRNHPWATIYAFGVDHEPVARVAGRLFLGTDVRVLYRATEVIGRMPDGSAILDIPCGSGVALRGLRPEQRVRYVAADIAESMLERTRREAARRGLSQVELREADVEALPFADGEFDLCVTFTGLHCFPSPRRAVFELARCVRPGGSITGSAYLTDVARRHRPTIVMGRAAGLMGPSASGYEVTKWLREAGFEDVSLARSGPLGYFSARRSLSP